MEALAVEGAVVEATEASVPDELARSLPIDRDANFWRRASRSPASEQKLR